MKDDKQNKDPLSYIRAAFQSLDIPVYGLHLTDYAPATFGNLVCNANTGIGRLRIIYDRQFEIDIMGEQEGGQAETVAALIKALDEAKRRSLL